MRGTARLLRVAGVVGFTLVCAEAAAPALAAASALRVGVNSAVNPNVVGTSPGALPRRLVIGQDVVFNERITTAAQGQTQILFVDQSTLTVGPNANMVIDQFVFDPNAGSGKIAASLTRGVFRFVGGQISKGDNAVTMRTPAATIGIRGGVFLARVRDCAGAAGCQALQVTFVYGKDLVVTGRNGVSKTLFRPGWQITVDAPGNAPSNPGPVPPGEIRELLAQLDGRGRGNGGAPNVPTDAEVLQSGVSNDVSNNIGDERRTIFQSPNTIQQIVPSTTYQNTANSPQFNSVSIESVGTPQPTGVVAINPTQTVSTPILNTRPSVGTAPVGGGAPDLGGTPVNQNTNINQNNTNQSNANNGQNNNNDQSNNNGNQNTTGQNGGGTTVVTVSGALQPNSGTPSTTRLSGFPFANGAISYTSGGGTFSAAIAGTQVVVGPLNPGSTSTVSVTCGSSSCSQLGLVQGATGSATTTADGKFFYANLTSGGDSVFIFGGVPASASALAANPVRQVRAFATPVAGTQTIPFLPAAYGGQMPNPTVSPLYVTSAANQKFGAPGATPPTYMQASLAINGQGANQQSALAVAAGSFGPGANAGTVAGSGAVVGAVIPAATARPVNIRSASVTVPDANGNTLFGETAIKEFVLEQNQIAEGSVAPGTATVTSVTGSVTPSSYTFNQPAIATSAPTTPSAPALNETGYFGGIVTKNVGRPMAWTGTTTVTGDPNANTIAATFRVNNRSRTKLQFGTAAGNGGAPSSYASNQVYAALGNTARAWGRASGSNPQLAMVTAAAVPDNWMPSGVTPCSCQYLQWGYWTGQVVPPAGTKGSSGFTAAINTWVAGTPTVNLPTSGTGAYSGAAVGTVYNGGATYAAAGNFNASYDFGKQTGSVAINQFDGANYSATVKANGAGYSGNLSGARQFGTNGSATVSGPVNGSFYGPGAVETGGGFKLQTASGLQAASAPRYLASGIFAGR
jgi:trimeric autotransporter adhesin